MIGLKPYNMNADLLESSRCVSEQKEIFMGLPMLARRFGLDKVI
jgi:hypothetical protein